MGGWSLPDVVKVTVVPPLAMLNYAGCPNEDIPEDHKTSPKRTSLGEKSATSCRYIVGWDFSRTTESRNAECLSIAKDVLHMCDSMFLSFSIVVLPA